MAESQQREFIRDISEEDREASTNYSELKSNSELNNEQEVHWERWSTEKYYNITQRK